MLSDTRQLKEIFLLFTNIQWILLCVFFLWICDKHVLLLKSPSYFYYLKFCCICWNSFMVNFSLNVFCSFGIGSHLQGGFFCGKPVLRVYPLELFCICFPGRVTSLGTQILLISQFWASWDHANGFKVKLHIHV